MNPHTESPRPKIEGGSDGARRGESAEAERDPAGSSGRVRDTARHPRFSTPLSCHENEGEARTSPKTGSSVAAPCRAAETMFPEDVGPEESRTRAQLSKRWPSARE